MLNILLYEILLSMDNITDFDGKGLKHISYKYLNLKMEWLSIHVNILFNESP